MYRKLQRLRTFLSIKTATRFYNLFAFRFPLCEAKQKSPWKVLTWQDERIDTNHWFAAAPLSERQSSRRKGLDPFEGSSVQWYKRCEILKACQNTALSTGTVTFGLLGILSESRNVCNCLRVWIAFLSLSISHTENRNSSQHRAGCQFILFIIMTGILLEL